MLIRPTRNTIKDKRRHGSVLYIRPKEIMEISLNFSTINLNGLLFWTGKNTDNIVDRFLGLGITNGHLKLASNLLTTINSTIDIPTGGFVSDGGWHNVQIEINKNLLQLSIDGRKIFTESKKFIMDLHKIDTDQHNYIDFEDAFYIGKYS